MHFIDYSALENLFRFQRANARAISIKRWCAMVCNLDPMYLYIPQTSNEIVAGTKLQIS